MPTMFDVFSDLLDVIGSFENFQEFSKQEVDEKHYRELCRGARRLLRDIGEEKVSEYEIRQNSNELKGLVRALKTMSDEYEQESMDEETVKLSYRDFIKHSGKVIENFVRDYMAFGPVVPKRFR